MAGVFEMWKMADEKFKMIVSGFVRSIQQEHGLNIPDVVLYLCLSYYKVRDETFELCGDHMRISTTLKENDTVHIDFGKPNDGTGRYCDAVGHNTIDSQRKLLTRWSLQAIIPASSIRVVGITSQWDNLNKQFYKPLKPPKDSKFQHHNYGYNGYSGYKVSNDKFVKYGEGWVTGDIVDIELDLRNEEKGTLTFYKNNISQGVAYTVATGEDIQYKLAIGFYGNGDGVVIKDFYQTMRVNTGVKDQQTRLKIVVSDLSADANI